ncbi:hypothetical protein HNQ77_005446 [Silvibacterium bohemicum]|uniref:PqqD family protein n=1 Tax=Silvibacterium bohemicum TaxID=1577686 RepID=A0A841KA65_9BACT|nr:PqqD family protein [Silvibacterium bohemicum]MBB6147448.1 hypothetical protein [Silvibacterium bohemicum]
MNNPRAIRDNIFTESLANETILYDKANHRAHSLNKTVAMVWEAADGDKSIDEIAGILHDRLGIPKDRSVVLLALEELETAGLIEAPIDVNRIAEHTSRREVIRKLGLAGASAALVPFVVSVVAPTPAMASSPAAGNPQQYVSELQLIEADIAKNANAYANNATAQKDLNAAIAAGNQGLVDQILGNKAGAQAQFTAAATDFNGVLAALGLPPL